MNAFWTRNEEIDSRMQDYYNYKIYVQLCNNINKKENKQISKSLYLEYYYRKEGSRLKLISSKFNDEQFEKIKGTNIGYYIRDLIFIEADSSQLENLAKCSCSTCITFKTKHEYNNHVEKPIYNIKSKSDINSIVRKVVENGESLRYTQFFPKINFIIVDYEKVPHENIFLTNNNKEVTDTNEIDRIIDLFSCSNNRFNFTKSARKK